MLHDLMKNGLRGISIAALMLGLSLFNAPGVKAAGPDPSADEEKLIQRIKEAVIEEIKKEGVIDKEVDAGIQRYAERQRAARMEAMKEQQRAADTMAKNVRRVSVERDHIYGDPKAEVSLIEYSDFECPYCKRFHSTLKGLVDGYGGKVNWVYRHYPLPRHNPGAMRQAVASECAAQLGGNDAFWKYANLIYERTSSNGHGFPVANLTPLAAEIGLDKGEFQACLDSDKAAARVQADLEEGSKAGISGTPGNILLNNRSGETKARSGAVPVEVLMQEVDRLLKISTAVTGK
jgi:protein-disulfide isomerase